MSRRSIHGYVSGRVQGVGFRYFVRKHAVSLQLAGYVHNLPDGRVEFLIQGDETGVAQILEQIRVGPSYARVTDLQLEDVAYTPDLTQFTTG